MLGERGVRELQEPRGTSLEGKEQVQAFGLYLSEFSRGLTGYLAFSENKLSIVYAVMIYLITACFGILCEECITNTL